MCALPAVCRLVQDRQTSEKFALKKIDRDSWTRLLHATRRKVSLLDEVEIMKRADHPNIVKVHEYFEAEKKVNVILDYCVGGDMLEYIQDHQGMHSLRMQTLSPSHTFSLWASSICF